MCSGFIPQTSFLMRLGAPYVVPEIGLSLAACKANAPPAGLSFQSALSTVSAFVSDIPTSFFGSKSPAQFGGGSQRFLQLNRGETSVKFTF